MFDKIVNFCRRLKPYFHLIISVVYGFLIIFSLIGALLGKGYIPTVTLVIVCLSWSCARILREASSALHILALVIKGDDLPPVDDEDHN
jgi:hypothetical protein